MGILEYIIIAAIVGLAVWLVFKLPIPPQIKNVILYAAVIVLILVLAAALGLFGKDIQIPKIR